MIVWPEVGTLLGGTFRLSAVHAIPVVHQGIYIMGIAVFSHNYPGTCPWEAVVQHISHNSVVPFPVSYDSVRVNIQGAHVLEFFFIDKDSFSRHTGCQHISVRSLMQSLAPKGISYTNFGPGMSMGHTVAVKAIEGVQNALSMTIPVGTGIHRRMVYIELKEGYNLDEVAAAIKLEEDRAKEEEGKLALLIEANTAAAAAAQAKADANEGSINSLSQSIGEINLLLNTSIEKHSALLIETLLYFSSVCDC